MGINMLLTIVGLLMLGVFMLSANRLMGDNVKISEENEYAITAISIAQSIIDEAKTKSFDQNTVATTVSSPSSLTSASSLGPGGSETVPNPDTLFATSYRSATVFNDVDDYNGYRRRVTTPRAEGYLAAVAVNYGSVTYPDSTRNTQTFCKRMTVTVTSPYMSIPIRLSYAFAY